MPRSDAIKVLSRLASSPFYSGGGVQQFSDIGMIDWQKLTILISAGFCVSLRFNGLQCAEILRLIAVGVSAINVRYMKGATVFSRCY